MSEPIRIYLKMNPEDNTKITREIDANNEARAEVAKNLEKETGCDSVFFTRGIRSTRLSLGFKEKQENADFKKKFENIEGYFVYDAKVKSGTGKAISKHEKEINEFPDATQLICEKYEIPTEKFIGMKLCRAIFGRPNNQVIGVIHIQSGEVADIPNGFTEITASEFNKLNQIKEKEAA